MIKGQVDRDRVTEGLFDTLALRLCVSEEQHKAIVKQLRLRDRYRAGEIQRKPGAE